MKYSQPPKFTMFTDIFLDNDGTPNTLLMLLELFFATSRYNSISKAQHLTALLPTEIFQNLGPKIVTIMNLNKSDYDYFSEIFNLVKDFYKPSQTAFFDKYFCTQSLGLLTPSQFLTKVCSDLEQLCPSSSSNEDIIRLSFVTVLSPTVRSILAGSEKFSLVELANITDKILLNLPDKTVSQIDHSIIESIKNLSDQVASLQLELATQRQ